MNIKSNELDPNVECKADSMENRVKTLSLSELNDMYEVLRKDAIESLKASNVNKSNGTSEITGTKPKGTTGITIRADYAKYQTYNSKYK